MIKCGTCKYKSRPKHIFPCANCDHECIPLTCVDCRAYWFKECKKGIRPCKEFKWS